MNQNMRTRHAVMAIPALVLCLWAGSVEAQEWTLVGWNNLGMHCMDADYSVFSLLPPFNTIQAQLIDEQGRLVRDGAGITVTYDAVTDPDGSINSTSEGKTNFWTFVESLFGASLPVDSGLLGKDMPGKENLPQAMTFDPQHDWFIAEGIPITPYDDAGKRSFYPLMRLIARDGTGKELARTEIVLPVSDEMTCVACHASGSSPFAEPPVDGWVNDPDPERDYRLNILKLHDDLERFRPLYRSALAAAGYSPEGLFETVVADGQSILCARCHASEALPGSGMDGIPPLTQAIHSRMAFAPDPETNLPLDSTENRAACYRCHPGSTTRCLRGAMGAAVAPDGSLAMQCQSCHGSMRDVAEPTRTGWLDEPACQQCHTGTAVRNSGEIRFATVFDEDELPRQAADDTFATTPDTPASGLSLYRFSSGHGGLQCAACHGSTHAIYPSAGRNDNLQNIALQGHVGVLADCQTCHGSVPTTITGGPHGLHPVGQSWIENHGHAAEENPGPCRSCHGTDYRGTVLSRALGDRVLQTHFGTKTFWRGFQIGCYACHAGPNSEDPNPNRPPRVEDAAVTASSSAATPISLAASDPDGDSLILRVVSQPENGTVGLQDRVATYFPESGFQGSARFTFAAWDGSVNSNLAEVVIQIAPRCAGDCNGDGAVTVDELVQGVNIALGLTAVGACPAFDGDGSGSVTVDEIVVAVTMALNGCSS